MTDEEAPSILKTFEKTENLFVEGLTLKDLLPEESPHIVSFADALLRDRDDETDAEEE
ncbi:MAG: hypothetical protein ACNA8W_06060 [Bradymonadaceae bacterium]